MQICPNRYFKATSIMCHFAWCFVIELFPISINQNYVRVFNKPWTGENISGRSNWCLTSTGWLTHEWFSRTSKFSKFLLQASHLKTETMWFRFDLSKEWHNLWWRLNAFASSNSILHGLHDRSDIPKLAVLIETSDSLFSDLHRLMVCKIIATSCSCRILSTLLLKWDSKCQTKSSLKKNNSSQRWQWNWVSEK